MSADLDALDRGVVDAGMTAAEAVARVEVLEKRLAEIERFFALLQGPGSRPPAGRHLTAVKP